MTQLEATAEFSLPNAERYLEKILDRICSFDAIMERSDDRICFFFAFGRGEMHLQADVMTILVRAESPEFLGRLKEILAGAVLLHAKVEHPKIVWAGDLSDQKNLGSFRLMHVETVTQVTPHMRRIRLAGENLARFRDLNGMHIRMFFPTADVPEPIWPETGADGLPAWPDPDRKPAARVYTVRKFDIQAGWMDVDFVMHQDGSGGYPGIGAAWAASAKPGDPVGIIGPVGRPLRDAEWYVFGCDETGLPALGRILENLPRETTGIAFAEIGDDADRQKIDHPDGVELRWIVRQAAQDELVQAITSVVWPQDRTTFGWFASESSAAATVRDHWRSKLGYGRDQTLAAGYWKIGQTGVMAG